MSHDGGNGPRKLPEYPWNAFDELRPDADGTCFKPCQLGRVNQHLWQHDVVAIREVRLNHCQRCRPDERPSLLEVALPFTDEGSEHVNVAVQNPRMFGYVAPSQSGLPDPGRPVEVDEATHDATLLATDRGRSGNASAPRTA